MTAARGLVDAYRECGKATDQMSMVAGSLRLNDTADTLLRQTMTELASQDEGRGTRDGAQALMADLANLMGQVRPSLPCRLDPERGARGSLEGNDARFERVMTKLASASEQPGEVNEQPAREDQQADSRSAGVESVRQEIRSALAFRDASRRDETARRQADAFFETRSEKVDGQLESRGRTLEPLERTAATSRALTEMTKKLGAEEAHGMAAISRATAEARRSLPAGASSTSSVDDVTSHGGPHAKRGVAARGATPAPPRSRRSARSCTRR